MCSIAGSPKAEEVENMLAAMRHRAPDGEGIIFGDYTIGMGRLAIRDLVSDGLSPFQHKQYILAYNGEVYNFKELREELKNDYDFKTESDTEVVLAAYIQWGAHCLDRFNGMFALAIYDGEKIFIARDAAGQKPLYYTRSPFRFASEAKALGWDCAELPRGYYGVYENGSFQMRQWWELKRVSVTNDPEKELERLLEDSIRLRTQADVPYGLYLSGGVDSSLISTFHKFKENFTYHDGDYKKEFFDIFPKMLWHLDYPVRSFSAFGLWKLAELASARGVKVVLSGEGADELFGGYVRYVRPHFNWGAVQRYPSYRSMFEPTTHVNQAGWEEFNGNMQELLRMGDRMAGAWGVENRCPFLDKRIIEFAFSLPGELKIDGLNTKVILNRILKRRNPEYRQIEKAGLYCRANEWLGEDDPFDKTRYMNYQEQIMQGYYG